MKGKWNLRQKSRELMQDLSQTDECLVDLLRDSDSRAFETIYRRYWKHLFNFVYHQVGSKEESEEIVHDLMLALWANRQKSNIQNLKIYLFVSARNLANKCIRSQINLRRYYEYQLLHEAYETSSVDQITNDNQLSIALERVLRKLPEKTAAIFKLSKIDELPVKKIALQMEMSDKAVEYHITKSLKLLRRYMQDFHSDN